MGKRPDFSEEMVDAAREIVRKTRDAGELRKALSVVLSGAMGLTLPRVGDLVGRSRATVARFHAEFREWFSGRQHKEKRWGGRRRAYLTFEEEKEFLSGFFEAASRGGILVVSAVRSALEKRLGHKVAETTVYRMLDRHGWRKIVPRRRHPKADTLAQEEFKKNSKEK
jgi:transposase